MAILTGLSRCLSTLIALLITVGEYAQNSPRAVIPIKYRVVMLKLSPWVRFNLKIFSSNLVANKITPITAPFKK